MAPIPVYLKTDSEAPRPTDPEFYWVTRDGVFLSRNHPFFASDVPTKRPVKALAPQNPRCVVRYPKIPRILTDFVVGFFSMIYELYRSESVVLLFWDVGKQQYRLFVPEQKATVKQFRDGDRIPIDVNYKLPLPMPENQLLVGDIHCHGNMEAYTSFTDRADEHYRDGFHGVVGRIQKEPPEFHQELAIDGHRFSLKFEQIFEGYNSRKKLVPDKWIDQVEVEVDKPRSWVYVENVSSSGYWQRRRQDDSQ